MSVHYRRLFESPTLTGLGALVPAFRGPYIGLMAANVQGKLDRDSPMPLWAQVLDDMRARLTAGEFATGFPAERELIAQYGVSRHTMREAMRRLHADGLIDRERGRGTFLRRQPIEQRTGALYSLFNSIESQGFEQRSTVLELSERAEPTVAAMLGVDAATTFIYLHRIRAADATPIAVDELWLAADLARPLLGVDLAHTSVYGELERLCDVRPGAGWERIRPTMPSADERLALGVSGKVPAFLVERLTTFRERPLEWRRTVIRGDKYSFTSSWGDTGETRERGSFTTLD